MLGLNPPTITHTMQTNKLYQFKLPGTGQLYYSVPGGSFSKDRNYFDIDYPGFNDVVITVAHEVEVPELHVRAPASLSFCFSAARSDDFRQACDQFWVAVVLENGVGFLRFYDRDANTLSDEHCRAEFPLKLFGH